MRNNQTGWTIWSLASVIVILVALTLLFMRLFPPYFDNLKLQEALEKMAEDPRVFNMTRRQVIQELDNILYIDYAHEVVDLKDSLVIDKKEKNMTIKVDYEVVVPLVYNLSALIEFKNNVNVSQR